MFLNKSLIALVAIVSLGDLITSVAADEWSETYESLFGVTARRLSPIEAKRLLNKLGSLAPTSSVPLEQKADVEFWLEASKKPTVSLCTDVYDKSLETRAVNHPALQEFSDELQQKLFDFCMDTQGNRLRSRLYDWSEQDSVIELAKGIKYGADVPEDTALARLVSLVDRRSEWLKEYVFDMTASKDANYIKFLEHFRARVPCEDAIYKRYTGESPNFLAYITRPKVYQKLDPRSVMVFRKILVCQKYNEMESVRKGCFDKIYTRLL